MLKSKFSYQSLLIVISVFVISFFLSFSAYPQAQDSIYVIISKDTVHIWNTGAFENCAALFRMDVSTISDTIYLTEVDTVKDYANCLCYFDLCTSVTGLLPGNYEVLVYRQYPLLYPDTLFFIGSASFFYGGSTLVYLSKTHQSDCYNITNKEEGDALPQVYDLYDNFPNPFNPSTTIKYQISEMSFVTLKLYDVLGNEIAKMVNAEKPAGSYEVEFNAASLPSGIYFYRLQAGDYIETKKMVLMK